MNETKTKTTFIGRINGVTYDTPKAFNEALEQLKNGTKEVSMESCTKCGKPECTCEEVPVEYIERPSLYATDVDYIVPQTSEFKTELLAEQWDDVNAKLERRMGYFVQQLSLRQLDKDALLSIIDKCEKNAQHLLWLSSEVKNIVGFLSKRKYYTDPIQTELNCIGEIIGFYHAIADNAKNEIEAIENNEAEKVEQEDALQQLQTALTTLSPEKLAQILAIISDEK